MKASKLKVSYRLGKEGSDVHADERFVYKAYLKLLAWLLRWFSR